jgi:uncharacterized membrane protein
VSVPTSPAGPIHRIASIDLIRGGVMILMAIDHVRVYSGLRPGGPTPGIFFTRFVTHFCAPAFVFLAGTSAFFHGRRHAGLPRFLLIRGAWLVLLELTLLCAAWTFNLDFAHYEMAGVIWAIGWCMILMAGLVKLPIAAIGALGVAVIAGHNLIDPHLGELIPALGESRLAGLRKILYLEFFAGPIRFGSDGPTLLVLYSIVPWIGVMAAGFAFGRILMLEPARRNRIGLGLGAIVLFVLRGFNLYGDPRPWGAAAEGSGGSPPMPAWAAFFYVLHIPLIHALALLVSRIRLGEVSPWLFANHPMGNPPPPEGYTWSLPLLYLVWAVAIVMLYYACRWFAGIKARRKDWWLGYL